MLILIAGLPGTGKTTIARAFAVLSGAIHLNSDVLRNEMGLMGQYTAEAKKLVYDALLRRAGIALADGQTVIVDSTFYRKHLRDPFETLARTYDVPLKWVEVQANEQILQERLSRPRPDSEADYAVYEKIRDQFEPLPGDHLVLQSEQLTPDDAARLIQQYLS